MVPADSCNFCHLQHIFAADSVQQHTWCVLRPGWVHGWAVAVCAHAACAHAVCAHAVLMQVRQIERRWALQEAAKYEGTRLLRTADAYESAVGFIDASRTDDWRVMHLNAPALELLGKHLWHLWLLSQFSSSYYTVLLAVAAVSFGSQQLLRSVLT